MINDELVNLETKVAYQEDTIQTLNDALCQQQQVHMGRATPGMQFLLGIPLTKL